MLNVIYFFITCATFVQYSYTAPWETNDNVREFDLEWQCEQYCNRLKGKLNYNSNDSACTCSVDTKDKLDFDSKHLEHKLKDLGFNFKIIDTPKLNRLLKRDTTAEKIKRMLAERNQQQEAPETVAAGLNPENENHKDEKISDKLHRLRLKLVVPKSEKSIITAPDNLLQGKIRSNLETDHKEEKSEDILSKLKVSDIHDNVIVSAPKEEPPLKESQHVENKVPEKPTNEKLSQLREKLIALKSAKHEPIVGAEKTVPEVEAKIIEPKEDVENKDEGETEVGIRRRLPYRSNLHIRRTIIPRPRLLGNKLPMTNNNKLGEKNANDRVHELRERFRSRLQSLKAAKEAEVDAAPDI